MAYTFLACGLLLIGASSLPNQGHASGVALKRAHPLFGKCTSSDRLLGSKPSGISFLQDASSLPSDEECLQLLAQSDVLFSTALKLSDGDSGTENEDRTTSSGSAEEIIGQAATLLREGAADDSEQSNGALKKIWGYLKDSASDSSLFVLGLGPELFAFSKITKNVIAVEHDDVLCQEFLQSKAGACAMQANVHIYCTLPASLQKEAESGTSIVEMINSATDTSEREVTTPSSALELMAGSDTERLMKATKVLIEDLVEQQFGDVPISALVVLGRYPLAKLLMMEKFLDQSTVIVTRSRMTTSGLKALSGLMRVLIYYEDGYRTDPHSAESVFLLQRLFSPAENEASYLKFATPEWELKDNQAPLELVDAVRQELLSGSFASGVSDEKRDALSTYLGVYAHASRRGTDEQWKDIKASLEVLRASVTKKETFDKALDTARKFAMQAAKASTSETGLQEYFKLLEETVEKKAKNNVQVKAVVYEFLTDATSLTASPIALERLKDSIENACELADSNPQLFLPALRLIRAGLIGEEFLSKVHKTLEGLVKLGPEADVAALSFRAGLSEA